MVEETGSEADDVEDENLRRLLYFFVDTVLSSDEPVPVNLPHVASMGTLPIVAR